jgi:hypothetical protein
MIKKTALAVMLWVPLTMAANPSSAAAITEDDSTQPRGAPVGSVNDQGQSLDPIISGFIAPAYYTGANAPDPGINHYRNWVGSMMGNTGRDPAFFAALNIANQDVIDYVKSLSPTDREAFLAANKLPSDATDDLLPVVADLCLRCHFPVGWLEGHSEPQTPAFPFLDGQFWGAAFREHSVSNPVDLLAESEAEMDGVQCAFCHRVTGQQTRQSLFDGSTMSAGNGGFFVDLDAGTEITTTQFTTSPQLCGTCHDVTNPLLKTNTTVNGAVPDMLHPIERTYTEWYWSGYRETRGCSDCHAPMEFKGAQTWLLSPSLYTLWGDVDQQWRDRGYRVPRHRAAALRDGRDRNRAFMLNEAATVDILGAPATVNAGDSVNFEVRVTNLTGHKLPTGFAEGRQMWIRVEVRDEDGNRIWQDGRLKPDGSLLRTAQTKVYEQQILAVGYPFIDAQAVDSNGSGKIEKKELEKAQHFHFALMNTVVKDNRIPPLGYKKAAYQADGAFIIPEDTYADGQNWDITPYTFTVPAGIQGDIQVTASLYYQTFNKEYAEFLRDHDQEPTQSVGGRARDLPAAFAAANPGIDTWGKTLHKLWYDAGKGRAVIMGSDNVDITVTP